ncbi:NSFL1 cofactor p47 [Babesia sp. Xinjiang]|uniref:NSFL1 cofactor p47 n=1 Tax=Babesia sp. Xinjiang TaxID=462227 RepID=UPI000A2597EB|nr:NSFL1 cofactor p47 [Babesia sp. Xinjiang]ORM40246.1 NSFL1 cofactor p47 [Babesia sp. Xinjiang]
MSNIRSFGDLTDNGDQPYSFAGGHNSAIGIEEGHTVHLYAGGFTVDDGPFRSLDKPENALFLSAVKNGVAPPELQDQGKEVRVYFIDDSHRQYDHPLTEPTVKSNSTRSGATSGVENISIDSNSGDTTTLRVKLYDNRQINLTVSRNITIGELRSIMADTSGLLPSSFRVMYGFPPREVNGKDSETLNDNDLLGCAVFQHLTG